MREELLAHVSGVFEAELATISDDRAALEQTAQRFGNPCDGDEPAARVGSGKLATRAALGGPSRRVHPERSFAALPG